MLSKNTILNPSEIDHDDPKSLFKFLPVNDYTFDMLLNGYLWMADPSTLNDPNDSIFSFYNSMSDESCFDLNFDLDEAIEICRDKNQDGELSSYAIVVHKLKEEASEEELRKSVLKAGELIYSTFGLLSLTSNPYNLSMWDRYSSMRRGICLQFKRSNELNGFFCRKVSYVDEFPVEAKVPITKILRDPSIGLELFYIKSTHWQTEMEWRLCKPLINPFFTVSDDDRHETGLELESVLLGDLISFNTLSTLRSLLPQGLPIFQLSLPDWQVVEFKEYSFPSIRVSGFDVNLSKDCGKVQCSYCRRILDSGNHARWHGDKCKMKPKG